MKAMINMVVRYKDISKKEGYRKALKRHSPLVMDGEKDGKLTNLF